MTEPLDPVTAMAAAAINMHEVFMEYVRAGFTEEQALELVKVILVFGMRGSSE